MSNVAGRLNKVEGRLLIMANNRPILFLDEIGGKYYHRDSDEIEITETEMQKLGETNLIVSVHHYTKEDIDVSQKGVQ